jgi:hypothetical protein
MSVTITGEIKVNTPYRTIDRRELAARVTGFILNAHNTVVVLHGRPVSGKTELIRKWVIPALRAVEGDNAREVWYGDCTKGFPGVLEGADGSVARFEALTYHRSILFIDDFGSIFEGSPKERHAIVDEVFGKLQQKDAQALIVLVTDSRHLTSIYALGSYEPGIVVFEIGNVQINEGLDQLVTADPEGAPHYHEQVRADLLEDAEALEEDGWDVTFGLLRVLDAHFRQVPTMAEDSRQYQAAGRLRGILRRYVEDRLAQLDTASEEDQVARALLERIVEAKKEASGSVSKELLPRLGVNDKQLRRVLDQMLKMKIIEETAPHTYELFPRPLGMVIVEDSAARRPAIERAMRALEDGFRSWSVLGDPLPRARYAEIHALRRYLQLNGELICFMLQTSLRYENGEFAGASEYWLQRMPQQVDGMDILLASMFAETAEVRLRAARLLSRFHEPEVRDRLRAVALTDGDPRVRAQAVASLEPMKTDDLLQQLLSEVKHEKSAYRVPAIQSLKLFKEQRVVTVLKQIVEDGHAEDPLRRNAISVLGTISTTESADALLRLAIEDKDEVDREEAAKALSSNQSPSLIRHILDALDRVSGKRRTQVWAATLTALALAAAILVTGLVLPWMIDSATALGLTLFLGASVLLVAETGFSLKKLAAQKTGQRSYLRFLSRVLFALCAVSVFYWVHGLPHMITGRWRRGLMLFSLQLVAIALVLIFGMMGNLPGVLGWIATAYFLGGVVLFVGSYLDSVYEVLVDTLLNKEGVELEQRKRNVYRHLFANAAVTQFVFDTLTSTDGRERARSRKLLARFATSGPPEVLTHQLAADDRVTVFLATKALRARKSDDTVQVLAQAWPNADDALRRRIAGVLSSTPTEKSIQALDRLVPARSAMRMRKAVARWRYRTSVWPRSARALVVLCVPLVAGGLFHGWQVIRNPAWGQIITLSSGLDWLFISPAPEEKMISAADVMSEHYPESSADVLLDMFREGNHRDRPAVHSAIAQGLVRIDSAFDKPDGAPALRSEVHEALLAGSTDFYDDLGSFHNFSTAAVDALKAIGNARDAALGAVGTSLLVRFVLGESVKVLAQDSGAEHTTQREVIAALGEIRPERALPALDTILRRTGNVHGEEIRPQIERVAQRAYLNLLDLEAASRAPGLDSAQRMDRYRTLMSFGRKLEITLNGMEEKPSLVKDVNALLERVGSCDQNADALCNDVDAALALIRSNPAVETGYRQILDYYGATGSYQGALGEFQTLKAEHAESVWPRKLLSELYHEYLPQLDNAFKASYDELAELRELQAYHDLPEFEQLRFEADFAEVALSAERYMEMEQIVRRLLAGKAELHHRLNMAIFLYIGALAQQDIPRAESRLRELQAQVASLPSEFYNNWIYPGTRVFINRKFQNPLAAALLKLCRDGSWYDAEAASTMMKEQWTALEALKKAPSRR